jgi:SAM-dependent methyltransferase
VVREQRLVFGEVAESYDRVRPGYPAEAFDEIVGALGPGHDRALEVGAGTGRATIPLAERGLSILAIEPSEAMAAVARRRCAAYRRVRFEVTSLEDWPVHTGGFALCVSAQAWHWVSPARRLPIAHDALASHGVLALLWNRVAWDDTDPVRGALDDVYERLVPELAARRPGYPGVKPVPVNPGPVDELEASPLFGPVTRHDRPWSEHYDAARYRELLLTQSDHRLLDDDTRGRLLDAVAGVVADAGGTLTVRYVAELFLARRA